MRAHFMLWEPFIVPIHKAMSILLLRPIQGYGNTASLSYPDTWVRKPDWLHLPYRRVGAPSFFLLCSIPLCKCTIVFFIHLFTDGPLGCFWHLAIVNRAAMNIGVHRFFWIAVSGLLGYKPSSGIARSKGSYIFSFLRKFHCFPQWLHQSAFPSTVY